MKYTVYSKLLKYTVNYEIKLWSTKCDQILENGSKSHMYNLAYNDISVYAYGFLKYFLQNLGNLSYELHTEK